MCTAIWDKGLFGRTLDVEGGYGEAVAVTPRHYRFPFFGRSVSGRQYAMIGTAHVRDGIPLYYDAVNEAGLAMAGLNFFGSAVYHRPYPGVQGVPSYALIPRILTQCGSVEEAERLLGGLCVTGEAFSAALPATPLHWMIADTRRAIVVESVESGLRIYDNPHGVLTNNPPFPYHEMHLHEYLAVDSYPPQNRLFGAEDICPYSRGMGGMGLPGDWSSASRFVRAVFARYHTTHGGTPEEEIGRFFHLADTVAVPRGCVKSEEGKDVFTLYTACADLMRVTYCYTTYACRRIIRIALADTDIDGDALQIFPMPLRESMEEQK